jgi:hypothetical protein
MFVSQTQEFKPSQNQLTIPLHVTLEYAYGGVAGYRPQVQNVSTLFQRLQVIYKPKWANVNQQMPIFLFVTFMIHYQPAAIACVSASSGSGTRPYIARGPSGPASSSATKNCTYSLSPGIVLR